LEPNHHAHNFTSQGTNLTYETVARIARARIDVGKGQASVTATLSADALGKVKRSRAIVDGIIDRGEVVYGITTGFGAFKDRVIPREELAQLQVNLILSQCVGVGPALPAEVVRAMMICRAHTLSLGYSGIRPQTLLLLYEMLNRGVYPRVPEQGSVGASGDLAPLSHVAAVMIGYGHAEWRDHVVPALDALQHAGLEPAVLECKEGLALSNGTSLMAGLLCLAAADTATLCETADVVGAMSLEALQGVPAAFDPRIHAARGQKGQISSAARIRQLTEGSTLLWHDLSGDGVQKALSGKVQDAYSLRCMPQVHGPVRDTLEYVRGVLDAELNGAEDNPLVFGAGEVGHGEDFAVISGGNFHGAPLSVAADYLGIALCQLANISERRQARLVDTAAHGGLLPAFLTERGGLNSGFMMVQYTAAALASENKTLAHPASVDTIPTSANVEDHVSMGPIAARHARKIAENTTRILALEAMMAAQAIDFRLSAEPAARLGRGTKAAYDLVRERVPFFEKDDYFYPHIQAVEELVKSGKLAQAALDAAQAAAPVGSQ
jgi:histidine ammonia-lyase